MTRQLVPTLLRLAQLTPGQSVLDVASGTGIAAAEVAKIVGPSGPDVPVIMITAYGEVDTKRGPQRNRTTDKDRELYLRGVNAKFGSSMSLVGP